jgi:hypothetical protein
MTGRWIVPTVLLLLVPACGMTVGLRPLPTEVSARSALVGTASADSTEPSAPGTSATMATEVAGVTMTTAAGTNTLTTTVTTVSTAAPVETTTTVAPETTGSPAETTTTTSEDVPPASPVSIPALPDIGTVFSDDNAFLTHDCADGDVTITGDVGTYTLEGDCSRLLVKGSFNTIFVDGVDVIDLTGTLNAVIYGAGDPVVNDWDGENIVTGG